jgi:hypothetical protein
MSAFDIRAITQFVSAETVDRRSASPARQSSPKKSPAPRSDHGFVGSLVLGASQTCIFDRRLNLFLSDIAHTDARRWCFSVPIIQADLAGLDDVIKQLPVGAYN